MVVVLLPRHLLRLFPTHVKYSYLILSILCVLVMEPTYLEFALVLLGLVCARSAYLQINVIFPPTHCLLCLFSQLTLHEFVLTFYGC